jgi:lipoprotein-anchoring transpeptidase ErfK/SrfK
MRILRLLCRSAIAAGVGAVVTGVQIAPASAQLFWDWGGGSMVGGSGREVVSFSPQYAKGQIIVSFGDRRLYYITQPGQALSYPIAIPREQSRWQGVTSVSDKRVNPSWTPTPTMVAENALAALGAGRTPDEPFGRARSIPGLQCLPHPRHRCAMDDWHGGVEGLHSLV